MTGLDISNKMVQLARAKNLYTSVMQVINTTLSLMMMMMMSRLT